MMQTPPPDGRFAKWILLLAILLALAARLAAGQENAAPPPGERLYDKLKAASVEVLVDGHLDGSGWFADPKGLLFTAGHVIGRPGRKIEILSPVAGRREAKVVAIDLGHDLALLSVEPREGGYPALALAEKLPAPGDDIFALGAPIFRHAVMFRGMVARSDTVFEYYSERYVEVVQVAATVPDGMSGGPWVNRAGEVVGLQSAVMSLKSVPVGLAYMSPLPAIRQLIKSRRTAATAALGAAVEEPWQQARDLLDRFPPQSEGQVVKVLQKDGPAARAGLKENDLIIAAEGKKVRLTDDLLRIVRAKQPGQPLELTVLGPDGTGQRTLTVRLGKLEAGWPEP